MVLFIVLQILCVCVNKILRVADESSSSDETEVVTFEQTNITSSSSDITENKQAMTSKSSGVVGRLLELKKRRQQLTGMFIRSLLILL